MSHVTHPLRPSIPSFTFDHVGDEQHGQFVIFSVTQGDEYLREAADVANRGV
jgi:hypothetical protein